MTVKVVLDSLKKGFKSINFGLQTLMVDQFSVQDAIKEGTVILQIKGLVMRLLCPEQKSCDR